MLKLTPYQGGNVVYIRADHVTVIEANNDGRFTMIGANGAIVKVTETPEQIMAMDEMVKAMNPLVSHNDPSHTMSFGPNWPYSSTTYGALPPNVSQCIISHHCPNWKGN